MGNVGVVLVNKCRWYGVTVCVCAHVCITHIVVYPIVLRASKQARTCYITAHNSQKTITSANEYDFTA